MEQRWEGGSGEEAEEQGGTPGSQDEDSQDSQWRTSTGEEDALPARRRRLRRQRAPRDNVVRCKSGYDGPGTAACSKDAAQGDAAAASADAIWPSDSDITVIRVRRHCAANLRAARSRRSGSACGSDASSGGGGGSGACGAGATGGGGACSCEGLLHPVDNPSMVNFATLVREGQRGAWRRRRHQREQLVPLSSWGPPGGRRWPRSAHAASTVTQPQSARPPQCTESASRQHEGHYVVRGSGGPCSRQVASASAGRPTHLLDLSLPPPTSQRDVAVIFAQQHWVPDSSVSATSSEFPDASLVLAGVAGEGAGATTAAAAAAVASTMTVAMPHPRTSIPDAHGTPRSSSARTHQPRHYHHYHHHHHHHHHHHRRRQVSRDGKEAPAACDVTERRGLRALLRAVAAACAGRHSRYK